MMRDEVLKNWMRSARPEPTPAFSGSVKGALAALPAKNAHPALRFVPVSAVVFAAVALLCVAVLNLNGAGNFFGHGNPGIGGGTQPPANASTAATGASATAAPASSGTGATAQGTEPAKTAMPQGVEVIGSCETKSMLSDKARTDNLALACRQLDGVTLQPGQKLSFDDLVLNKGIAYEAPQIMTLQTQSEQENPSPAGITQVASTLLDAALLSGLDILERHPCELPVGFVDKGQEAYVSQNGKMDLVLCNNHDFPVWIKAEADAANKKMTVTIYGQAWQGEHPTELISDITKTLPAPSLQTSQAIDANTVITPSRPGYEVSVLRRWADPNTKKTRDETLYTVRYEPSAGGVQPTPSPTPTPGAPGNTAMPANEDKNLQKINEAKTDNGITETLLEAESDGYVFYMKIEYGPFTGDVEPYNTLSLTINGKKSFAGGFSEIVPSAKQGYYTETYRAYLAGLGGKPFSAEFESRITKSKNSPATGKALANFTFKVNMTSSKPGVISSYTSDTSGDGTLLYANKAHLVGVYESPQDSVICLDVSDNEAGDLTAYFNKHLNDKGNGRDKVLLEGSPSRELGIVLYKGLVSKDMLDSLLTPKTGAAAKEAYEAEKGKLYYHNMQMILSHSSDDPENVYHLLIVNMNPAFVPDTDLSVITYYYNKPIADSDAPATSYATCSIMQLRMQ